jgi:aspartyl-tRNA(Asn)/glutamyl-tRNA(Gln) amidotransferase subunit B
MEVHVQLCTQSKMFTGAVNGFGGEPNTQVDEQVLGLPGVLPVMNKTAIEYAIKVGLALDCKIAKHTKWDRKSYYYPDLPKNYQISQYDLPLCHAGNFELTRKDGTTHQVRIRRAHLEEDAGKLLHEAPGGYAIDYSIVDLNRAGTPLLEIVTEPDLSSPQDVSLFGQELQKLVQFLGVSHGQMQMGHMRFEPNINVHITDEQGQIHKTAITEIKNLNSFAVLEKATAYELQRQIRQWEDTGDLGRKSTYGWDDTTQSTFLQREKEEANDYRYFPDPDLVPVEVDDKWISELHKQIGELPKAKRKRYIDSLGLSPAYAMILTDDPDTSRFYESAISRGGDAKRIANLIIQHGRRLANEKKRPLSQLGITPEYFANVAKGVEKWDWTSNSLMAIFNDVQAYQVDDEGNCIVSVGSNPKIPTTASASLNSIASIGAAVEMAVEAVLGTNPKPLQDYRAGKQSALGALVGMVMKNGKGLNPKMVQEALKRKLEN